MTLTRRATLQWVMAAATLPLASQASSVRAAFGDVPPPFDVVDWPKTIPAPAAAKGYGRDPNLMEPSVPWSLTLTSDQRKTVDLLADMILPADEASPGAGSLGVGAFIDEWISAPYPSQRKDREKIIGGLIWLDAQANALHRSTFNALSQTKRSAMLDALTAEKPNLKMLAPVAFMDRFRSLLILGFYSLPEGKTDMGYIGNEPTEGAYPGPSKEALQHYGAMLDQLGIAEPKPV